MTGVDAMAALRFAVAALAVWVLSGAPAAAQPARDVFGEALSYTVADKQLREAMSGYFIDEAKARQALAAGANVNHRDTKMNNQTLLIDRVRQGADVSVIRWLLQNGADPTLTDSNGRNAAYYASPLSDPAVAALLGGGRRPTPVVVPAAQGASAADLAARISPGVYECYGQNAMVGPMAFSILDGATYMGSNGRTGRYAYNARTGVLLLDPGGQPARFKRSTSRSFYALNPDGSPAGFTCPLNTAKNPRRPPW
jgi:hypothetical protein